MNSGRPRRTTQEFRVAGFVRTFRSGAGISFVQPHRIGHANYRVSMSPYTYPSLPKKVLPHICKLSSKHKTLTVGYRDIGV
jgi:hypothetical protein